MNNHIEHRRATRRGQPLGPFASVFNKHNVPSSGKPSDTLKFFCPDWLRRDQKVILFHDEVFKQGYLSLDENNVWEFVTRDSEGKVINIQYLWKIQIQENIFDIGWESDKARQLFGCGRHVSATNLHNNCARPNLRTALLLSNKDRDI